MSEYEGKYDSRQEGPGPHEHPDTRRGSVGVRASSPAVEQIEDYLEELSDGSPINLDKLGELLSAAGPPPAPDAELDELLAAALGVALPGPDLAEHRLRCGSALRRHLAAWAAAKGAEAELLRGALVEFLGAVLSGRDALDPAVKKARSALARPRPSASGLLELLDAPYAEADARAGDERDRKALRVRKICARRLAAELGLEESSDA